MPASELLVNIDLFTTFRSSFRQLEGVLAALQLVLAMLGMGATLHARDFKEIVRYRQAILFVLGLQFLIGPFVAAAAGWWLPLPGGVALGILLLAVMPSGSLSNVFTHLGHGNLPLSITATVASTLTCLLCTPLLLDFWGERSLPDTFQLPVFAIVRDVVLYLLLPMLAGMAVRRRFPSLALPFARWAVRASMVVLAIIAIGSVTSGRIDIGFYGWLVPVVLVVFVIVQFIVARGTAWGLGYSAIDSYTLAVEAALRNGNLAILLSSTMFPTASAADQRLGSGALYVALFYGGASLVIALLAVTLERRRHRSLGEPIRPSRE